MKLRLPKGLRAALLACIGLFSPVSTTVSVATLALGFSTFSLQQARAAEYTIKTNGDSNLTAAKEGDIITMNLEGYLYASNDSIMKVNASMNIMKMIITDASSGKTYDFNGELKGSGGITLAITTTAGTQTWNFNGDVSGYTGTISISGGTSKNNILTFSGDSTINASSITTDNLLKISGTRTINSSISAAKFEVGGGTGDKITYAGGDRSLKGNIDILTGATFEVKVTDSLNYDAASTITLESGSTLRFASSRWSLNNRSWIVLKGGSITGTGQGANGSLDFYQSWDFSKTDSASLYAVSGNSIIDVPVRIRGSVQNFKVDAGATLTINGDVLGTGGFTKTGGGELIISSRNRYEGGTTIAAGTLSLIKQGRLGTGAVTINADGTLKVSGGSIDSSVTNAGNLNFNASTDSISVSGKITNNNRLSIASGSRLIFASSIDNTGAVTVADGAEITLLNTTLSKESTRTKTQGNGFGLMTGLTDDEIKTLRAGAVTVTGSGAVTWEGTQSWGCLDTYYIYNAATAVDSEMVSKARKSVYVGENVGVVKPASNVAQGIAVTVKKDSVWDISGLDAINYNLTLDGGSLYKETQVSNTGTIIVNKDGCLILASAIANSGTVTVTNGAEITLLNTTLSKESTRTKTQGNGFGLMTDLTAAEIDTLKGESITGSGTKSWTGTQSWGCSDTYYIHNAATAADLMKMTLATESIYVGEKAGVVKLTSNVKGNINVTVCKDSAWDINGKYDSCYTVTLNGGTLTNTGGVAGTSYMQIKGIFLTADSEIAGDFDHCLLNQGYAATTLNLGGHTLTKNGDCTFTCVSSTIYGGGTLRIAEGAFVINNYSTAKDCVLGSKDDPEDSVNVIWLAGGTLSTWSLPDSGISLANDAELRVGGVAKGQKVEWGDKFTTGDNDLKFTTVGTNDSLKITGDIVGSGELVFSGKNIELTNGSTSASKISILADSALTANSAINVPTDGMLEITTAGKATFGGSITGVCKLAVQSGGDLTISSDVLLGASIAIENDGNLTLVPPTPAGGETSSGVTLKFTSKDALTPTNKIDYIDNRLSVAGNGYADGTFYIIKGAAASTATEITSVLVGKKLYKKPDTGTAVVDPDTSALLSDGKNVKITGDDAVGGWYFITLGGQLVLDDDGITVLGTDPFVYDLNSTDNLAADEKTTGLVIYAQKSVPVVVPNPTPDAPDATTTTEQKVLDEDKVTTLVLKNSLNENAVGGIIVQSKTILQLDGTSTTDADGAVTYSIELDKATIETTGRADGTTFTPTLTLTGTGLYKMDKATGLDADATKVGPGWSGAVQVTNTELGGNGDDKFYITALNNLGSNIEISGLSGYACGFIETTDAESGGKITTVSKDQTVTANLNLTDIAAADENTPAVAALTLTDAPDKNLTGGTLTLSGNLSGEGSIVNNSTGHVSLGGVDISGWTGSYTASEASSVLTLAADAKLNASVTGGSVTLKGDLNLGKTMSLSGNLNLTEVEVVDADSGKNYNYSTINLCERALTDEAGDPTEVYEMPSISVDGKAVGNASDGILNFTMGSTNFLKSLSDGGEFVLLSAKGGITGYSGATLNKKDFFTDGDVRYYVELGATSVTLSKVTLGLQWKGDVWTKTTGFDQSSALDGDSVVSFTGVAPSKVEVDGAQVVKSINVDAYGSVAVTEYTFTGDSITTETLGIVHGGLVVQNELKVNDLTSIHTGTTLTVNEGGSLTGGDMSNNGTLSIGEGSVVTVNTLTGDGAVSGDGKLVVESGSVSASTLGSNTGTIEMDSLNDSDAPTVGGTLLVRQSGSYAGAYKEKTSIGTTNASATQILRTDAKLTVIGRAGTVSLTGLNNSAADDNKLGGIDTKGETVLLNNVRDDVAADGTTTTKVPAKVTLVNASRMEEGVLDFTVSAEAVNGSLNSAGKPVVTTGAALSLKDVTLKVHEVQNEGLNLTTGGQEKDIVLFVVNDTPNNCEVDNVTVNMDDCPWMTKYFTNFRVVEGSVNVIGDANTGRYAAHGQTPNGTAGLALAGKAMFRLDPQVKAPTGELAQVLDMLDTHLEAGNKGAMDKLGAALAGSSLSAVGMAVSDDVQRQLRAIRNRTTTMGVNECVVNEDMPYVNGWISGDGNYRQLSESGTDAGYQVSSWGGTVGVDVDVNPNLTLGVAVSALFGDYTGKAADTLTGDLDTQYVSLFARVSTGSWVNTFVGTLGRADVDLERTLPGIAGKTTYKTNGMMFGFLYEVARTFALNEDASTCVQPLFNMSFTHTSLDSATEGGTADTRLTTDSASLTQFSLGLGGRLQSIVGENEYNRASIFEARALLKLDFGDRYNKLNTALAALPNATVTTRSNESGVIGAEVGASLTIPISQDAGSVFFDVNADFRADQTGVNGSVGYRINF